MTDWLCPLGHTEFWVNPTGALTCQRSHPDPSKPETHTLVTVEPAKDGLPSRVVRIDVDAGGAVHKTYVLPFPP